MKLQKKYFQKISFFALRSKNAVNQWVFKIFLIFFFYMVSLITTLFYMSVNIDTRGHEKTINQNLDVRPEDTPNTGLWSVGRWHLSPKFGKFENWLKLIMFDVKQHSWYLRYGLKHFSPIFERFTIKILRDLQKIL